MREWEELEDDDLKLKLKIRIIKIAALVALTLTILFVGLIFYFNYKKSHNKPLENINYIADAIENAENHNEEMLEYEESSVNHISDEYFLDATNTAKYALTLAIMGKVDEFFQQFDPNVFMDDFAQATNVKLEQQTLFDRFTRNQSLKGFRVIDERKNIKTVTKDVLLELVYQDGTEKEIRLAFNVLGNDHDINHRQYYIVSSIHELVNQIEG